MPELPEVETVKLQLEKYLVGHKIQDVEIRYKKCFEGSPTKVKGGEVRSIRRFGKVISIDLSNDYSLVIHIKLTGQLVYRGPNLSPAPPLSSKVTDGLGGKHTHVIFELDKDGKLYYNDFRKFGWIRVVKTDEVMEMDFIKKLGPEPIKESTKSPLPALSLEYLEKVTSSSKRAIKTLIMDQSVISGVGNIYANDALWLSEIHPQKKANELNHDKLVALFKAIETVLKRGLENEGASELSFVSPDGSEGNYQKHFLVYGRDGEKCKRCNKGTFKKIKVGGRGTVFCPVCQKMTSQNSSLFQ